MLKDSIQNTKKAHLALCFESKYYDEAPSIDNFELAGKVIALDQNEVVTSIESQRENSFYLNLIELPKVRLSKYQSGFQLRVPLSKVFGQSKRIPNGSKLKFYVYARPFQNPLSAKWCFFNCEIAGWELVKERSFVIQGKSGLGTVQLHDFGTITIKKEIENSDSGVFELVLITEDNVRAAEIANVEIKIELVK